jgi:hypothetical protein
VCEHCYPLAVTKAADLLFFYLIPSSYSVHSSSLPHRRHQATPPTAGLDHHRWLPSNSHHNCLYPNLRNLTSRPPQRHEPPAVVHNPDRRWSHSFVSLPATPGPPTKPAGYGYSPTALNTENPNPSLCWLLQFPTCTHHLKILPLITLLVVWDVRQSCLGHQYSLHFTCLILTSHKLL